MELTYRGKKGRCLIIAEAGVNHNGRIDTAMKLCDAAKDAGADVVKFQTWNTERVISRRVQQAKYQSENTGVSESQFDMLKKLELPYEAFGEIKRYCDSIGIRFASTPDDEIDLDYLVSIGIPFIKVASGDIGNVSFLRNIGSRGLPVILSTGMSSLGDVDLSLHAILSGGCQEVYLLHCTTNYPCSLDSVNLRAMLTLKEAFKCEVGYSDHTIGYEVSIAAVAMGAAVIEKHLTLDRGMFGPDHLASTEPHDFKKMVKKIRNTERAMGNGIKTMSVSEGQIKDVVIKRIVAKKIIKKGDVISKDNVCVKRSPDGEPASLWDLIMGVRADKDYNVDQGITFK